VLFAGYATSAWLPQIVTLDGRVPETVTGMTVHVNRNPHKSLETLGFMICGTGWGLARGLHFLVAFQARDGARTAAMHRTKSEGFTLIELLMVVAIIGIIAAIAIPGLLRSKMSANEASAIASMRSVSSAQSAYAASCGWGYYATTLEDLALAPPLGSAFLGPDLGTTGIIKSAYVVTMASDAAAPGGIPPSCNTGVLGTGYHATAIPLPGTGSREFGTNTTGAVYYTDLPALIAISDQAVANGLPLR
jgi:prepilin-type N-terminal cleavage/methylation domain-containing protein